MNTLVPNNGMIFHSATPSDEGLVALRSFTRTPVARVAAVVIAAAALATLAACKTTEGAGKDMENLGKDIQHSADKHSP